MPQQNTEHRTRNTEHGTQNMEHETQNTERGTQNSTINSNRQLFHCFFKNQP